MRSRTTISTLVVLFALLHVDGALSATARPQNDRPASFAVHYRVVQRAYRQNHWSLLNAVAAPEFRFVGIDGAPKRVADLERAANAFSRQGGRIIDARLRVVSVNGRGDHRDVLAHITLDVRVPRAGGQKRMVQVDDDHDTWRRVGRRWVFSRSLVRSEAVTQYGPPAPTLAARRTQRSPNLGALYFTIDRAFRTNHWDLVRPFAAPGAHFVEVDGSVKTFQQMDAGGAAFLAAGGEVTSAHMRLISITSDGTLAITTVATSADGSYPVGRRRLRFAQRDDQRDTWRRINGRWLFAEGRVIKQTISTFAP